MRQKAGSGVKWEARNASGMAAQATLENINVHEVQLTPILRILRSNLR